MLPDVVQQGFAADGGTTFKGGIGESIVTGFKGDGVESCINASLRPSTLCIRGPAKDVLINKHTTNPCFRGRNMRKVLRREERFAGAGIIPLGSRQTSDLENCNGLLGRCAFKHRNRRRESAGWGRRTAKRCQPYSDAP